MVGTSLECCIAQMVKYDIHPDDVEIIIAGTFFNDIWDAFEAYFPIWYKYTGDCNKCIEVLERMWPKVVQVRKYNEQLRPYSEKRWWFKSFEEMIEYQSFFVGDGAINAYSVFFAKIKAKERVEE